MYFITNYEMFTRNFYQMNTKLKHKEVFKFWTQRKGKQSNIKSEYFQNTDTRVWRYFCFQLRI